MSRNSCFPTISNINVGSADGFRPVSDLFGLSTNFHINVGSGGIAAFLQFQAVSDLFQTSLLVSDGFRPTFNFHINVVSDLFQQSTNFHINVSADIAFLQFQTVSDLFQTSVSDGLTH